jgi:hypothetical protein
MRADSTDLELQAACIDAQPALKQSPVKSIPTEVDVI